jgi:anti-sigma factor RsiW
MMTKTAIQAVPQEPLGHAAQDDDTLSTFLDGELADEQARRMLRHLNSSTEARDRAWEYLAVGDALRGLHAAPPAPHLTARIMAALEQEPTILAPMHKPRDRRTTLWLAAAAVTAITWGLWQSLPDRGPALPVAANDVHPPVDVQPYLAAHQDFAQAVIAPAEMNFTQVSLMEHRP